MIAYITSVGEPTTALCQWSLERNGFDVRVFENPRTTLAQKLKDIYFDAVDDFVRVDADIIVNRNFDPQLMDYLVGHDKDIYWWQFITFDWYKQDLNHSLSFIRKEAIQPLGDEIGKYMENIRPETEMSRIAAFYKPRRFETYDKEIMGIHGYGIEDMEPVIKLKAQRGQSHLYDFELAERLNQL